MIYTWSTTKTHPNNANDDERWGTTKRFRMPRRIDKMTTNDNMVQKRHARNTRRTTLHMKTFISSNMRHQDVES
jgi:hypothetical protein